MVWWFKEGISNERLDIILNPSHFLVVNYILDGMMLKRKKLMIQWRKFGLKRSCILRIMNFWIFIWINFLIKIAKKKGFTYRRSWRGKRDQRASWRGAQDQRASWCGTRDHHTDATWHWSHLVGPRVARARRRWRTGRGHVAGGHTGPRRRLWGAPRGRRASV